MGLFEEKRKFVERRIRHDGPPSGQRERRLGNERREVAIAEIPFAEWVAQVVRFQQRRMLSPAMHPARACLGG